jgi:ATP-dependent Clp protease adapter protein ClpS
MSDRVTPDRGPSGAPVVGVRECPGKIEALPPYRVILHNDDKNDFLHVIETLVDLTPLTPSRAADVTMEAHKSGLALVLMTHRERAELYVDQFQSKALKVTIEPAS